MAQKNVTDFRQFAYSFIYDINLIAFAEKKPLPLLKYRCAESIVGYKHTWNKVDAFLLVALEQFKETAQ